MYIQMYTTFGLELVVQTSPVFQAYVKVGPQFKDRTLGKKSGPRVKEKNVGSAILKAILRN